MFKCGAQGTRHIGLKKNLKSELLILGSSIDLRLKISKRNLVNPHVFIIIKTYGLNKFLFFYPVVLIHYRDNFN